MARWTVQDEIRLFQAMRRSKPVGVHKHFAILNIVEELKVSLNRHVTVGEVWDYIGKLYDVSALDEFETAPFPNEVSDFSLPESDFPETISDTGSEADQKQSVADSLDLDSSTDTSLRQAKSRASDKASVDDHTPRRAPKRTRAAAVQQSDNPSSVKRRRV